MVHMSGFRAARKMSHKGLKTAFRLEGTRIGSLLFCRKRPLCKLTDKRPWDLCSDRCFPSSGPHARGCQREKGAFNEPQGVVL